MPYVTALSSATKIVVVGGGDTAITEALHLTKFAANVTIIHRRNQLRAGQILQEKITVRTENRFSLEYADTAIEGADMVERIRAAKCGNREKSTKEVGGVFISVGTNPDTEYVKSILPLDESGYIITNEKMETPIPGIFAAGDIRHNSARQAITAAGDGATAAIYAQKYLMKVWYNLFSLFRD